MVLSMGAVKMGLSRRVLSRWACQGGPVKMGLSIPNSSITPGLGVEAEPRLKSDRYLPLWTRNTVMRRVKKSTDVHSIYDISEYWKCARAWLTQRVAGEHSNTKR